MKLPWCRLGFLPELRRCSTREARVLTTISLSLSLSLTDTEGKEEEEKKTQRKEGRKLQENSTALLCLWGLEGSFGVLRTLRPLSMCGLKGRWPCVQSTRQACMHTSARPTSQLPLPHLPDKPQDSNHTHSNYAHTGLRAQCRHKTKTPHRAKNANY